MATEIPMPALSPTMEEGTLAKWLVKEGDTVSSGDIIAEIETDKATMEFEAVDEGTIGKIIVAEGSERPADLLAVCKAAMYEPFDGALSGIPSGAATTAAGARIVPGKGAAFLSRPGGTRVLAVGCGCSVCSTGARYPAFSVGFAGSQKGHGISTLWAERAAAPILGGRLLLDR